VQEVLLSLHLHRGSYDATVPVSAWVQAIARHRLIDHWRRAGLRQHESFDELLEQAVLAEPVDEGAGARTRRAVICPSCWSGCPWRSAAPSS
jgi:RNA polymerase sigma-70 factor (ECF subfamily)